MKKSLPSLVFFVSALILAGCNNDRSSQSSEARSTEFTVILHQLEAARSEIRGLRQDMAKLREDIEDLKNRKIESAAVPRAQPTPAQPAQRLNLELQPEDVVLGNANAGIAIVEFTDYQCPFCLRFHQSAYQQIRKNYVDTGKIRYVVRDFPLSSIHPQAENAAIAANCAGQQGKYREMRDLLFDRQNELDDQLYTSLAAELALDSKKFTACTEREDSAKRLRSDIDYGRSIGVGGTPNFFIGRIEGNQVVDARQIVGAQPYRSFSSAIEALLD